MSLDVGIIIGFLAVNLAVGLYYGRGVKTIGGYALGGRNFSTAVLTATIVATWVSGSIFSHAITQTYKGFLGFCLGIAYVLNLYITSKVFAPRVKIFLGKMSVAEVMGSLYGKEVRFITGFAAVAMTISLLALQIKVFSMVFSNFIAINEVYATCICTLIVITYSAMGGIRSVTFTDVIQMITFGIFVPVLAIFIWKSFGSVELVESVFNTNPNYDLSLLFDITKNEFWVSFMLFLYFMIPGLNPAFFQRALLAKDVYQAKRAFATAALICLVIYCCTSFIGFMTLAYKPGLEPNKVLAFAVSHFVSDEMKIFLVIGIIAMVMSTADSWLNAGSVIFAHDICAPLGFKNHELATSRIFAIISGVGATILALSKEDLISIDLFGANFYIPIVTIPLMLGLFRFRTSSRVILSAMALSISVVLFWKYNIQPITGIDSVIPGLITSLISILSLHYTLGEPGGWLKDEEEKKTQGKPTIAMYALKASQILSEFASLEAYKKYLPKQEEIYGYFSLSVFASFIVTMSIDRGVYSHNAYLINSLQGVMFAIAIAYFAHGLWSEKAKEYKGIIWFISIFLGLAVIGSFLVLLSEFSHVSLIILTVQMILISFLVGWRAAIFMMIMGIWISFWVYQKFIGNIASVEIIDIKLKLAYVVLIVGGLALTVVRNRQDYLKATEDEKEHLLEENEHLFEENKQLAKEKEELDFQVDDFQNKVAIQEKEIKRLSETAQRILNNVNHELRLPVGNVINFAEMLGEGIDKFNEDQLKMISEEVVKNSNRLSSMILNMLDLAMLEAKKIELAKTTLNMSEMVAERSKRCFKNYAKDKKLKLGIDIQPEILAKVDANYMRQVVDNIVINAINYTPSGGEIKVTLKADSNQLLLEVKDTGLGIPEFEKHTIFEAFAVSSKTLSKAEGRGLGLALCKRAVEAHGGKITVDSDGKQGAHFKIFMPLGR